MFNHRHFRQAIATAPPAVQDAVDQAANAGVPWVTIIMWFLQHGGKISEIIQQLIDGFLKKEAAAEQQPE